MSPPLPPRATAALLLAAGVLVALADAEARVGGGESFGTGRGGGGRGGYGGGGGDGGGELVYLLVHLAIRYPAVGVPMLIGFGVFVVWSQQSGQLRGDRHRRPRTIIEGHPHRAPPVRSSAHARDAWSLLAQEDPALSEPVFHDLAQLVFRRVYEAVGTEDWSLLRPYVTEAARGELLSFHERVTRVEEVVVASSRVVGVRRAGGYDEVEVAFASSRLEHGAAGPRRYYVEERWTFRRRVGARSLAPEPALRLGCPACGVAAPTDAMGACSHCGTPVTAGQLQWQAAHVVLTVRRGYEPPAVGLVAGGEEPSWHAPTVVDPALAAQLRAFSGRHPDFDAVAFDARVRHVFLRLQEVWSAQRWQDARPYCTDAAWNQLRFWIERYAAAGLRNRMDDVRVARTQVVRVTLDAWYEAVTLRVWASARDWVEDERGKVVGGNARTPRSFSEYWTFLRAVGSGGASRDPAGCPSCGAPLDRVNAAGVCGYCDSVITTGRFDWVLSRIEQAEVYRP